MFALHAASRTLLAAGAFAAFGAAFVTSPIVARGAAGAVTDATPRAAPRSVSTASADVVPRRDPFSGGDAPQTHAAGMPPQAAVAMPPLPPLPHAPAALRALPANAGADGAPFPFATSPQHGAPVVTAVITGRHPYALVDEAGTTRVLTIGDAVDGDAITAIGVDGVRLSRGTLLAVARPTETAPSPALPHPIPGGP